MLPAVIRAGLEGVDLIGQPGVLSSETPSPVERQHKKKCFRSVPLPQYFNGRISLTPGLFAVIPPTS